MIDQQYVIEFGQAGRAIVQPDEREWLDEKLGREPGSTRLRVSPDDLDTEGHGRSGGPAVRVIVSDDDDTEGHALSIHFPSTAEADAFRKRLMLTGALVGTVALGAAGGIGLANLSNAEAGPAAVVETGVTGSAWTQDERPAAAIDATVGSAWTQDERPDAAAAATQTGPLDAHEAPAFEGLSAADQAYADRLSGQAAAMQTGPLDAHEAPAFQNAATQVGPMDVHEAPAFQNAASDEGDAADAGGPSISGPTPR